jgi:hypothetical protein
MTDTEQTFAEAIENNANAIVQLKQEIQGLLKLTAVDRIESSLESASHENIDNIHFRRGEVHVEFAATVQDTKYSWNVHSGGKVRRFEVSDPLTGKVFGRNVRSEGSALPIQADRIKYGFSSDDNDYMGNPILKHFSSETPLATVDLLSRVLGLDDPTKITVNVTSSTNIVASDLKNLNNIDPGFANFVETDTEPYFHIINKEYNVAKDNLFELENGFIELGASVHSNAEASRWEAEVNGFTGGGGVPTTSLLVPAPSPFVMYGDTGAVPVVATSEGQSLSIPQPGSATFVVNPLGAYNAAAQRTMGYVAFKLEDAPSVANIKYFMGREIQQGVANHYFVLFYNPRRHISLSRHTDIHPTNNISWHNLAVSHSRSSYFGAFVRDLSVGETNSVFVFSGGYDAFLRRDAVSAADYLLHPVGPMVTDSVAVATMLMESQNLPIQTDTLAAVPTSMDIEVLVPPPNYLDAQIVSNYEWQTFAKAIVINLDAQYRSFATAFRNVGNRLFRSEIAIELIQKKIIIIDSNIESMQINVSRLFSDINEVEAQILDLATYVDNTFTKESKDAMIWDTLGVIFPGAGQVGRVIADIFELIDSKTSGFTSFNPETMLDILSSAVGAIGSDLLGTFLPDDTASIVKNVFTAGKDLILTLPKAVLAGDFATIGSELLKSVESIDGMDEVVKGASSIFTEIADIAKKTGNGDFSGLIDAGKLVVSATELAGNSIDVVNKIVNG